jgi:hypothetical protein
MSLTLVLFLIGILGFVFNSWGRSSKCYGSQTFMAREHRMPHNNIINFYNLMNIKYAVD